MSVEIHTLLSGASRYWTAPFHYESEGTCVLDACGSIIVDVRGWGFLTGKGDGALGLSEAAAERVQDDTGKALALLLNANWPGAWHEES